MKTFVSGTVEGREMLLGLEPGTVLFPSWGVTVAVGAGVVWGQHNSWTFDDWLWELGTQTVYVDNTYIAGAYATYSDDVGVGGKAAMADQIGRIARFLVEIRRIASRGLGQRTFR